MISDMVLVKEIPKAILDNVSAYIGCISGAEKKTDYLKHIEQADFKNVQIVEETTMPIEALISQKTAAKILKELKMTMKQASEYFGAAVSMKVSATKP